MRGQGMPQGYVQDCLPERCAHPPVTATDGRRCREAIFKSEGGDRTDSSMPGGNSSWKMANVPPIRPAGGACW